MPHAVLHELQIPGFRNDMIFALLYTNYMYALVSILRKAWPVLLRSQDSASLNATIPTSCLATGEILLSEICNKTHSPPVDLTNWTTAYMWNPIDHNL